MKYLILDFGKVIAGPTTGHWFITPYFMNVVDISKIGKFKLLEAFKKFDYLLGLKLLTEEEEYNMFVEYYSLIFKDLEYDINEETIKNIAYDITYNSEKYTIYDNVKEELDKLSKEYTLLMLTDNWPCVLRILKEYEIYDYFDKVYVSSIYGCAKKDGIFFDYLIDDYNIKEGDAMFIDDNEALLDIAYSKGIDVKLMDREKSVIDSKYEIINDFKSLIKKKK